MAGDYPAFRKIPRLFRELIVTEKIDGTNGLIAIEQRELGDDVIPGATPVLHPDENVWVRAGSRNRWLTPESDNFGFAAWVRDNAEGLAELGPGHHYGEWWGAGIQRRYGLSEKRFSLFNTSRWVVASDGATNIPAVPGLGVVPVIDTGTYEWVVHNALSKLLNEGSFAAPGFNNPEGVVVYHTAANAYYKVTLDDDGQPKTAVGGATPKGAVKAA